MQFPVSINSNSCIVLSSLIFLLISIKIWLFPYYRAGNRCHVFRKFHSPKLNFALVLQFSFTTYIYAIFGGKNSFDV